MNNFPKNIKNLIKISQENIWISIKISATKIYNLKFKKYFLVLKSIDLDKLPLFKNFAPLKNANYHPQICAREKTYAPHSLFTKFSLQHQIMFAKRLSILTKAGIPILGSLKMLQDQSVSHQSARIIKDLRDQMECGRSLASGMNGYRHIFGEFAINIVRVGEMSGTLADNLNYLADELKKKQELRRNIIGALIYPAFIMAATIAIVIMLTVFLFPKILPVFSSLNTQLPLSTRTLIFISNATQKYWLHFSAALLIFTIAFGLLLKKPSFKFFFDCSVLRLPILGSMFKSYYIANTTRTLGLLIKSEVGILEALRIVSETSGSQAYRQAYQQIAQDVMRGETVAESMKKEKNIFPALVPQMAQVGEATGSLYSSLMYISEMFEDEMNSAAKNLTTSIEPVLMVIMGILVGFVALSIITPIYGITQNLHL